MLFICLSYKQIYFLFKSAYFYCLIMFVVQTKRFIKYLYLHFFMKRALQKRMRAHSSSEKKIIDEQPFFIDLLNKSEVEQTLNAFLRQHDVLDIIILSSELGHSSHARCTFLFLFEGTRHRQIEEAFHRHFATILEFPFHVEGVIYAHLFASDFTLREKVLHEGYSVQHRTFLCQLFGYANFVLFRYRLKGLNDSERMQFYYALHGRGKSEGILKRTGASKLSESLILVPLLQQHMFQSFFHEHSIPASIIPLLLPERKAQREHIERYFA